MMVRFGSCAALGLLALGLGGCSGKVETHIRSDGSGVQGTPLLMWQPEAAEGTADPALDRAKQAVADRLQQQGFRFAEQAPVMLSVGLAERADRIAVQSSQDAALSPAHRRKGLFPCKGQMVRLSISMTDSATGEKLYGGTAQEAHCKVSLDQLVPYLAETALADLAAPRGVRTEISPLAK